MLESTTVDFVSCTVQVDLGDDENADTSNAWRCVRKTGEHQVQDVVCEVMNEKVSTEILAPASGVLKIEVLAETPVKKGAVIASVSS